MRRHPMSRARKPVARCPDDHQCTHTPCRFRRSDGPERPTGTRPPQRPGVATLVPGGRRCVGSRRPGSGDSPMEPLHRGVGAGRTQQDRAHARALAGRDGRGLGRRPARWRGHGTHRADRRRSRRRQRRDHLLAPARGPRRWGRGRGGEARQPVGPGGAGPASAAAVPLGGQPGLLQSGAQGRIPHRRRHARRAAARGRMARPAHSWPRACGRAASPRTSIRRRALPNSSPCSTG
ncbi:hypothetical protein SAMN02787144_101384 [Streptomyces atratus]|uniref:Uncharacterized protein n=1 Tax=Streptomyces atratus TaxID=1893 RepID=A0A1K2DAN7_STRAR|nr:hypothetical protein SAMN02787144_101384 [Streptomyces atratus]